MASSSAGPAGVQDDHFEFNELKLRKVEHVLEFVTSRTSKSLGGAKWDSNTAVHDMAKEIHSIWTRADCPPKSILTIKKMYKKLVLERKSLSKRNKKYELRKLEGEVGR